MVGQINGIVHRDSHISSALRGDQASRNTNKRIEVKEFAVSLVSVKASTFCVVRSQLPICFFFLSFTTPVLRGRSRTSTFTQVH